MKCVFLVGGLLILQVVCAAKNITLSIDVPQENPADVSYVKGKAPEELKAGPAKNITRPKETIAQAAFIRSSNREIPKDEEIENEEFERFIQKYHSRPTIETVFVSTSPSSPLAKAEDSEELNEETNSTTESQVEVFNRPSAQLRTFERSVAHPTLSSHILPPPEQHHPPGYAIVSHHPHDESLHHGGSASFSGSDGYIFQANGGGAIGQDGFILQSSGGANGGAQFVLTDGQGSGGDQQYYQYANFVPTTFNVAQNAVKTKTYEIRRPAIQKHYYDIEERVIVRPAGSIIVELDRPVAKVPTGETVVAIGGLTGTLVGNGFQQSQQGGISIGNAFGLNGGGIAIQQSGGGLSGSGITYTSSVGAPSLGGSIGGGIGIQQQQGGIVGPQGGLGIQQQQGGIGGAQGGLGIQQQQGGIVGPQGGLGIQQQQGGIGGAQGGLGIQQQQGGIGVAQGGLGIQQQQGGIVGPQGGLGIQQQQGGIGGSQGGLGIQQQQGGIVGPQGGLGIQQQQGGIGGIQGGVGVGIQQQQGGIGGNQAGAGFQQSQGGIAISTTTQSPFGSPTSTVVIGTQQQQGVAGASGAGFQQSQSGIAVTTTPAPSIIQTSSTTGTLFGGVNGGFSGVGVQQSQGGIGITQGGISGAGFQQSQGGVTISTTPAPAPANTQTSSTTNIFVSDSSRGISGASFSQTQGGGNTFGGGAAIGGFQQGQGGAVFSTTGAPFFPSTTPFPNGGGLSGVGFQQSQGGIGGIYSTTGAPFFPSTTPFPNSGGLSGVGFQQSQGGIGISQGGGFAGAGFQQSQGGVISTTPAPYLPPPPVPTPTVLIGGSNRQFSGSGFQQSQSGIGLAQGGPLGGIAGVGFQQSQGGIGLDGGLGGGFAGFQQSQGGLGLSQGDSFGSGFQQSSNTIRLSKGGLANGGEIIYSTTSSPSYSQGGSRSILLRSQHSGGYPSVSTTTGGPIIISTINPRGNNFLIQANSKLQSEESVTSTTTTERSFAKTSSSGSIEDISKNINPYKIAVGEPDFSYPPYVEITSNGSPLAHLTQQPYTQASSQDYPRMRYQGKLLTGEVRIHDESSEHQDSAHQGYAALSSHHQSYETPTYLVEIPPIEQSPAMEHKLELSSNQHSDGSNYEQQQHQLVGSSKQPLQDSKVSSSAHQQSHQVYQHDLQRAAVSQPLILPAAQHAPQQEYSHSISSHQQSASQVAHQQAYPQYHTQRYVVQEQVPIQSANYQSRSRHFNDMQFIPATLLHQEHTSQVMKQQKEPVHHNLVAQIRHQQLAAKPSIDSTHSKQEQVTESLEEPVEVSEVHSSTHQQPTLFQQQVSSTVHTLEPYTSGRRQYKQRGPPLKYTQDQSLNPAPTVHTVYFNNNLEHTSARSQNLEIPKEAESLKEETTNKIVEASTTPSTTHQIEVTTQPQRQTYASVVAQSKPGILYAPPRPAMSHHSPGHKQHHFLRFTADGSSLFQPFGRQLHLVYSQSPPAIYPHQSQIHSVPAAPIEPYKQHNSASNKDYQIHAQLPITRQSQIELSASNSNSNSNSDTKPAPVSEAQITRSQSQAASHQTSAHYEAISSTTPETATSTIKEQHTKQRAPQKYRNEQTHGAITLRSGRTYGDQRVIASTPAPNDGGAASESVQTRRIVVNHPFQTIQEVVEREPFTNIHQVTVNAPAKQVQLIDGLQEGQQKSAAYRAPPAPYKLNAQLNHPHATLSFHHGAPH